MKRQRNMAQRKEQNKTPEKELSVTEITNLTDAEFKTLVIRKLRELTEYSNNMKEEMKVTLNEMEMANLSDAGFKTLVIRMLRELTEHGNNIK